MVTGKVDPENGATPRPGRGTMTWIGFAAIIVFVIGLAFAIFRPAVDRADGPEVERPATLGPAPEQPTSSTATPSR